MAVTAGSYLMHLRNSYRLILTSAMLAALAGFLIFYAFTSKYTSESVVLIEGQKVPEFMVQPVVSSDLTARVSTLQQQVLAESKLRPLVQRVFPGKNPAEVGAMIDTIRENMAVEPVPSDLMDIGTTGKGKNPDTSPFPGFYVKYTAPNARDAQLICNELTTLLVDENSKQIADAASGTSELLNRGLEVARQKLLDIEHKLASLKKQGGHSAAPGGEVSEKLLNIDYEVAQKTYQDLSSKKTAADLTIMMNDTALGERMFPLNPADLPDSPLSPNRRLFATSGLAAGLVLGICLALARIFR
jgi:uncharacterized protein involved in exopolysaccharide biosynthesis